MQSLDKQVLSTIRQWRGLDRGFVLVTVAATWGAAPRPAGSWLAIRDDGCVVGSVSGGCIEDDLIDKLRRGQLRAARPFVLTYGVSRDEALSFGLPCGGTLELLVEPHPDAWQLQALDERLRQGELLRRTVSVHGGHTTLLPATRGDRFSWDGKVLTTLHGPQWRLLLVGAGDIARYIAPLASALEFDVTVCDPRQEHAASWDVPGTRLVMTMPDDTVMAMAPDVRTAIVVLTHDAKLDDMALLEALPSSAFFVGALGSRRTNDARRQRLMEHFGFTEAEVGRLRGPVGLPIGSRTPPEIAVSILAELTAERARQTVRADASAGSADICSRQERGLLAPGADLTACTPGQPAGSPPREAGARLERWRP